MFVSFNHELLKMKTMVDLERPHGEELKFYTDRLIKLFNAYLNSLIKMNEKVVCELEYGEKMIFPKRKVNWGNASRAGVQVRGSGVAKSGGLGLFSKVFGKGLKTPKNEDFGGFDHQVDDSCVEDEGRESLKSASIMEHHLKPLSVFSSKRKPNFQRKG